MSKEKCRKIVRIFHPDVGIEAGFSFAIAYNIPKRNSVLQKQFFSELVIRGVGLVVQDEHDFPECILRVGIVKVHF